MTPRQQLHHILPNHPLLSSIQSIDATDMQTYGREQTSPARHWTCPDHGVRGAEVEVDVGRAAAGCHDGVGACGAGGGEDGLGAFGG